MAKFDGIFMSTMHLRNQNNGVYGTFQHQNTLKLNNEK